MSNRMEDLPSQELEIDEGEQLDRDRRLLNEVQDRVQGKATTVWEHSFIGDIRRQLGNGRPLSARQRVVLRKIGVRR